MKENLVNIQTPSLEGILLIDKPVGCTSFSLVATLRRLTGVRKIGHAGTLDPFASGLMVLLIGKKFTVCSDEYMGHDKQYEATITLGKSTDTFDLTGTFTNESPLVPSLEDVQQALSHFQGQIEQIPPMFSAKKVQGQKLYHLARNGKTVERKPSLVHVKMAILSYTYPELKVIVDCSKGTYIRCLAHDIGQMLGCGGYASSLRRLKCGDFSINQSLDGQRLKSGQVSIEELASAFCKTR